MAADQSIWEKVHLTKEQALFTYGLAMNDDRSVVPALSRHYYFKGFKAGNVAGGGGAGT